MVRFSALSVVPVSALLKLTFAPAALPPVVVSIVVVPAPFKVTGLAKLTASPVVLIERGLVIETVPVPAVLI